MSLNLCGVTGRARIPGVHEPKDRIVAQHYETSSDHHETSSDHRKLFGRGARILAAVLLAIIAIALILTAVELFSALLVDTVL